MSPSKNKPLKKGLWKNISPGAYFLNFTVALQWIFTSSTNIADWLMPRMINVLAVDCLWKCFPPFFFSVMLHCSDNPCKNNGTCHEHFDNYTCDCLPGFTGDQCQGKDQCLPCEISYDFIRSGMLTVLWHYTFFCFVFVFSPTIISYSYISYVWENLLFRDRSLLRWAM